MVPRLFQTFGGFRLNKISARLHVPTWLRHTLHVGRQRIAKQPDHPAPSRLDHLAARQFVKGRLLDLRVFDCDPSGLPNLNVTDGPLVAIGAPRRPSMRYVWILPTKPST